MKHIIDWANQWNGTIGLLDLILGIVGFCVTIVGVYKAKNAAESAARSASEARESLIRSSTISELSVAIAGMEELKRLHREGAPPPRLIELYSSLRGKLIVIRTSTPSLNDTQRKQLQAAISQLAGLEESAERSIADGTPLGDVPKTNRVVTKQMDKLAELLASLRTE